MSCDYNRSQVVATFHAWAPDGALQGSVRVERRPDGNWWLRATGNVPTVPAVFSLWGDRTAAYLAAQDQVASFEATLQGEPVGQDRSAFDVVAAGYIDSNSGAWVNY
jgi:hypothetical protein